MQHKTYVNKSNDSMDGVSLSERKATSLDNTRPELPKWQRLKKDREDANKAYKRALDKYKYAERKKHKYVEKHPHVLWSSRTYKLPNGDRVRYNAKGEVIWRNGYKVV